MKYDSIHSGIFVSRKNRFIAEVNVGGSPVLCHVKNTGRLKELLVTGAEVFLEESKNPERKTKFDLISVKKDGKTVNIDSTAPNAAFGEFLKRTEFFGDITDISPECRYKNSRFDFFFVANGKKTFAEVKGVTLERDGTALFPDAPTERGIKHINELCDCVSEGYMAYIVFVIQMKGVKSFSPNAETHKEFAQTLAKARQKGVGILCFDCEVSPDSMFIDDRIEVVL